MILTFLHTRIIDERCDSLSQVFKFTNLNLAVSAPDKHMSRLLQIENRAVYHLGVQRVVPVHF